MYTINDLAVMTGLTARTIRNYMKLGLLDGEKVDGVWRFTAEQFSAFVADPNVKPSLQAKKRGIVFDFLANDRKNGNAACVVLDLKTDGAGADEVSRFFCDAVNRGAEGVQFAFWYENGNTRVILSGPEDCVQGIMAQYYCP